MSELSSAPKGTYYYIIDELERNGDFILASEYSLAKIDNVHRFAWYSRVFSCIDELELHDKAYDIEGKIFSDFKIYFRAVNWVMQNDPKALEYMMAILSEPVYPVVKSTLIYNLQELGFYESCDIVKKFLKTKPPLLARDYERKRRDVLKELMKYIEDIKQRSTFLDSIRTNYPDKLYTNDPELIDSLSALLNINTSGSLYTLNTNLNNILWLYKADKDLLGHLFSEAICIETKDLFINPLIQLEEYELVTFFKKCIPVIKNEHSYFNIPPYKRIDNDLTF